VSSELLRDIITEIGEERDMIGNEAVKDFFGAIVMIR
jgi:hypothetical protein